MSFNPLIRSALSKVATSFHAQPVAAAAKRAPATLTRLYHSLERPSKTETAFWGHQSAVLHDQVVGGHFAQHSHSTPVPSEESPPSQIMRIYRTEREKLLRGQLERAAFQATKSNLHAGVKSRTQEIVQELSNIHSSEQAVDFLKKRHLVPAQGTYHLSAPSSLLQPISDAKRRSHEDFDSLAQSTADYRERTIHFEAKLNKALAGNKSEKLAQLEKFLYSNRKWDPSVEGTGIERFNSEELLAISRAFWNMGAYSEIVVLILSSKDAAFKEDPLTLEMLANSMMKSRLIVPEIVEEVGKMLSLSPNTEEQGVTILGKLAALKKNVAENTLEFLEGRVGKHHSSSSVALDKQEKYFSVFFPGVEMTLTDVRQAFEESLKTSLSYYQKGFEINQDPRLSCRVMHRMIEVDGAHSKETIAQAKTLRMLTLRDGALETNSLAIARAHLESLLVLQENTEVVDLALKKVVSLIKKESQLRDSLDSLGELSNLLKNRQSDQVIDRMNSLKALSPEELQKNADIMSKEIKETVLKDDPFLSSLHDYRGKVSNYISGNFKYAGQLPSVNLNRVDQKFFNDFIDAPIESLSKDPSLAQFHGKTLGEITNYHDFQEVSQKILRELFNIEHNGMERLDSEAHKEFDHTVKGMIRLFGGGDLTIRKNIPDSRTNVSANLLIGVGDCRHAAQAMQLVYHVWQQRHYHDIILNHEEAIQLQETHRAAQLEGQIQEHLQTRLMIGDFEVYAPIELSQENYPVWTDGNLKESSDGQYRLIESHTMNVLVKVDDKNNVSAELQDVFYHNTYNFKDQPIDLNGRDFKKEGVFGGTVTVKAADGSVKTVPVLLKPTAYAGERSDYDGGNGGNLASRVLGLPFDPNLSPSDLSSMRTVVGPRLKEIADWNKAKEGAD